MKQLLIAIIIIGVYACENASQTTERKDGFTPLLKTKEDSLYHEVMQGHDVGMAKMGMLRKQISRVKLQLDSIDKISPLKKHQSYKQDLLDLAEDLSYADHAMFTWMQEFNVDSARSDQNKRLAYLESEKIKVQKVRDNILQGLQRADSLLGK